MCVDYVKELRLIGALPTPRSTSRRRELSDKADIRFGLDIGSGSRAVAKRRRTPTACSLASDCSRTAQQAALSQNGDPDADQKEKRAGLKLNVAVAEKAQERSHARRRPRRRRRSGNLTKTRIRQKTSSFRCQAELSATQRKPLKIYKLGVSYDCFSMHSLRGDCSCRSAHIYQRYYT
jgi:hypothetical protein